MKSLKKKNNARLPVVVGIMGLKGSGKTTLGELIVGNLDKTLHINLADELKNDLARALRIRRDRLDNIKHKSNYRKEMQELGCIRRAQDKLYWIKRWRKAVSKQPQTSNIVCSDVRYVNEAANLNGLNRRVVLIKIERPGLPDNDTHISENEWKTIPVNYTLRNDGNMADLERKARLVVSGLLN